MASTDTKVLCIPGFGPIDRNIAESRALYASNLGIPFHENSTGDLEGAKHFAVWPLTQARSSTLALTPGPSPLT